VFIATDPTTGAIYLVTGRGATPLGPALTADLEAAGVPTSPAAGTFVLISHGGRHWLVSQAGSHLLDDQSPLRAAIEAAGVPVVEGYEAFVRGLPA
jgi:hypothetical protein